MAKLTSKTEVSVIIPIHNGLKWIETCFNTILKQTCLGNIKYEVCVCNDASQDSTKELLNKWSDIFKQDGIVLKIFDNVSGLPGGVGYSKNKAVSISSGDYLCFQDVDDLMLPDRVEKQYNRAIQESPNTIIGSKFTRYPPCSTARYTKWANNLTPDELNNQIYTAYGPTVIMPTWFCHRSVFNKVGGFSEDGKGTPEDLIFFYKHLDSSGKICRVDEVLLVYNYHPDAETFSVHENTIWNIRIERLERVILSKWATFTIWNAGKQGRKFYNCLSKENQKKVIGMCDVDKNKIGKRYLPYDPIKRQTTSSIPIISFQDAHPPFVICVKLDLTGGDFEKNITSLNLIENKDYVYFS